MKSLSLSQPHMIILVGLPGSGKSFFAEKFSETFSAPFLNSDTIANHINNDADAAQRIAHDILAQLVKAKQSIIVEIATQTRNERHEIAKKARSAGYIPLFVWVQVDQPTAKSRSIKNGLSNEQFTKAEKRFTPPNAQEKPVVISGKHTYATQAKVVLKKLSPNSREASTKPRQTRSLESNGRRNITIR